MSNYNRQCRDCGRWINMRQMPHGKFVAFEGDEPHKCDKQPESKAIPPARPTAPRPSGALAEPFTPLYPRVDEPSKPAPPPARPQPTQSPNQPRPAPTPLPRPETPPRPTPVATPNPTPRPAPAPRPETTRVAPTQPRMEPKPSRFGAILAVFTWLLSSTFGLMFFAFTLLSLPLSILATMHLTGWSWFGALIGVLFFSCIPGNRPDRLSRSRCDGCLLYLDG